MEQAQERRELWAGHDQRQMGCRRGGWWWEGALRVAAASSCSVWLQSEMQEDLWGWEEEGAPRASRALGSR